MIIKSFIHLQMAILKLVTLIIHKRDKSIMFLCQFTDLFRISFCHFLLNYLISFPMENLPSWREQVSQAFDVHRTFEIKTNIAAYNI